MTRLKVAITFSERGRPLPRPPPFPYSPICLKPKLDGVTVTRHEDKLHFLAVHMTITCVALEKTDKKKRKTREKQKKTETRKREKNRERQERNRNRHR